MDYVFPLYSKILQYKGGALKPLGTYRQTKFIIKG